MVKLNYTNRKVEGEKLGRIIAKDLLKRVRSESTASARGGHSSTWANITKDPLLELHAVDKNLTDAGVLEISRALAQALDGSRSGTTGTSGLADGSAPAPPSTTATTRLEELCLSGNGLTARGLDALRGCILLASRHLKDVDLSRNAIRIVTDDEACMWEAFLKAFRRCRVLRRLDLGGNPLGPRAFEIWLRLYYEEDEEVVAGEAREGEEPRKAGANGVGQVHARTPEDDDVGDDRFGEGLQEAPAGPNQAANGGAALWPLATSPTVDDRSRGSELASSTVDEAPPALKLRGLRHIPYLVLSDVHMTDLCALHLSYVVEAHRLPADLLRLLPAVKCGAPAQLLEHYDLRCGGCRGIIYRGGNGELSATGERVLELAEVARSQAFGVRETHEGLSTSTTSGLRRRSPTKHLLPPPQLAGVSSSPGRARTGTNAAASSSADTAATPSPRRRRRSTGAGAGAGHEGGGGAPPPIISGSAPNLQLAALSDYARSELDHVRTKIQGRILKEPGPHAVALWTAALRFLVLARAVLIVPSPRSTATTAAAAPAAASPSRLPRHLWCRILLLAADRHRALHASQAEAVMAWAAARDTLRWEAEARGKPPATQIWRVLRAVGCLTYNME
ncbi:MAG: hypothetical protein M1826_003475 [Phylliscum demangeonii]|nr:MAG: hypothetical protein M1826_003475 [Phylliscum demangeonii]